VDRLRRPVLQRGDLVELQELRPDLGVALLDVEALASDPKNWVAARALAALYQQTGRLDDAIEQYQRAAAGRPDDPQLWSDYGVTWSQLGDEGKAAACFRKALEIDPTSRPR
jgi:Flp pilus assembly protein TadD